MQQVYVQGIPLFANEFLASSLGTVPSQNLPSQVTNVPEIVSQPVIQQQVMTPNVMPVRNGHGPGKKECPQCHKVHGARKQICECGYTFPAKGKQNLDSMPVSAIPQNIPQNTVPPVQTIQTPTIDLNKWVSLGKAKLSAGWVNVGGIALSDNDTGYTISSLNPLMLSKDGKTVSVDQKSIYIDKTRLTPEVVASLL